MGQSKIIDGIQRTCCKCHREHYSQWSGDSILRRGSTKLFWHEAIEIFWVEEECRHDNGFGWKWSRRSNDKRYRASILAEYYLP